MAGADRLVNLPALICRALGLDPVRTRRAIEFSVVGATGAVLDLAVTLELLDHTHYLAANTAGFLLAVTWNFVWNWIVVFDRPDGQLGWQYISYVVLHAVTFAGRAVVVAALVEGAGVEATVATVVGVGAAAVLNFLGTERIFDGVGEYWFDVVAGVNQLAHSIYGSSLRRVLQRMGLYSPIYGAYMRVLATIYRDDVLTIHAGDATARVYTEEPAEIVSVLHTLEKERPIIEEFVDALDDDATVWDVGANLGVYAVLAADVAAQVVAFEPVPSTARRCSENLRLNGVDGTVVPLALSDAVGRTELVLDRDEVGTQTPRIDAHVDGVITQTVATADGDTLLQMRPVAPPDAVKIDVEGAEAAVLDGLADTLERHVSFVCVETHGGDAGIRGRLEAVGFDIVRLDYAGQSYLVGRKP